MVRVRKTLKNNLSAEEIQVMFHGCPKLDQLEPDNFYSMTVPDTYKVLKAAMKDIDDFLSKTFNEKAKLLGQTLIGLKSEKALAVSNFLRNSIDKKSKAIKNEKYNVRASDQVGIDTVEFKENMMTHAELKAIKQEGATFNSYKTQLESAIYVLENKISPSLEFINVQISMHCNARDIPRITQIWEALKKENDALIVKCYVWLERIKQQQADFQSWIAQLPLEGEPLYSERKTAYMRIAEEAQKFFGKMYRDHVEWLQNHATDLDTEACDTYYGFDPLSSFEDNFDKVNNMHLEINTKNIQQFASESTHADFCKLAACDWRWILKELTNENVQQMPFMRLLDRNKKPSSWFQPATFLSGGTAEGVTWKVGFMGIANLAVMKYSKKRNLDEDNNLLHEMVVGKKLNEIVDKTPNFAYMYAGFMCSMPDSSGRNFTTDFCTEDRSSGITTCCLMELVDNAKTFGDFINDVARSRATQKDLAQLIMQTVCSLAIAYEHCKYIHGDLHAGNILVYKMNTPVDLTYTIKHDGTDKTVTLPACEYIAKIIDYGRAKMEADGKIFSPITFAQHDKDQIFDQAYIENLFFMPNKHFPQFYDVAHLFGSLITSIKNAGVDITKFMPLDKMENLLRIDFDPKSLAHSRVSISEANKDFRDELCVRTQINCGYKKYSDYLKELHQTFDNIEYVKPDGTFQKLKNLKDVAIQLNEMFQAEGASNVV